MEPGDTHWFQEIARFLGPAYLRNAFTKGTEQEVAFLVGALGLRPGTRVLDVGCGPGRHALALARRGIGVVGVDISEEFVDLARRAAAAEHLAARFEVADARALAYDREFDVALSLCQGAFGLLGREDRDGRAGDAAVLSAMAAAVRPGGAVVVSAFSACFALRHLEPGDTFDADAGVNHERATVRDGAGREREFDLWTSCFTPRELRLLAAAAGLDVEGLWAVAPGRYGRAPADLEHPEYLLVGRRP